MDAWNNLFNRTPPGQSGNAPSTNPMGDNGGDGNPFGGGGGGIGAMWSPQADQSYTVNMMTQDQANAFQAQRDAVGENYLWENDPRIDPFAWTMGYGGLGAGQGADGHWITPTGRGPNGEYGGWTGQGDPIIKNSVDNIDPRLFGQIGQWLSQNPGKTFHDFFTPARNNFANHFDQAWLLDQFLNDPDVPIEAKIAAVDPNANIDAGRLAQYMGGPEYLANLGNIGNPEAIAAAATDQNPDYDIGSDLDTILNDKGGGVSRKQIRKQHPNASGKKIARLKAKANAPGTTPDALAADAGRALAGQPSRVPDGLGNTGGGSGLGNPPPGAGSALTGPPRAPGSAGGTAPPPPAPVKYDPVNKGVGGFGGGQGGKKNPGIGPNNRKKINAAKK